MDLMVSGCQWSALQEMVAICCDSRHIEAKRRCHAREIWVAITVAQAHRNAAGTDLTGSGDTSDIPTGSPRPWKPCGPAWRTWKWRSASLTASHAALQESLKTMCFWGPRAIRCGKQRKPRVSVRTRQSCGHGCHSSSCGIGNCALRVLRKRTRDDQRCPE